MADSTYSIWEAHPAYTATVDDWVDARTAFAGAKTVKALGERYLPKLGGQSDDEYSKFKQRASYLPVVGRLIDSFEGLLFRRDPSLEAPEQLDEWTKDVDGSGKSLHEFARDLTRDQILLGRVGLLVDFPGIPDEAEAISIAEADELAFTPRLIKVSPEAAYNWRTDESGRLVEVRIEDVSEVYDPETFEIDTIHFVRVLQLVNLEGRLVYRQRLYKGETQDNTRATETAVRPTGKPELISEVIPMINGEPLNFIPFWFVDGNDVERGPIQDVVDLSFHWYRLDADHQHGLHMVGLPTPWVTGVQTDEESVPNVIGPATIWALPNPDSKVGFLQIDAGGLASLEKEKTAIEGRMASLGARFLAPEKRAAESGEALGIRNRGETSALASVALDLSDALTNAIKVAARWSNVDEADVSYTISRDFDPGRLGPQDIRELVAAHVAGVLPIDELLMQFKRGEILPEDADIEDVKERIAEGSLDPLRTGLE